MIDRLCIKEGQESTAAGARDVVDEVRLPTAVEGAAAPLIRAAMRARATGSVISTVTPEAAQERSR